MMEENITNQDTSSVVVPLNEPHFDEEATLLSARPVVPLTEVKAEGRSRRRLVFVFSILIAVAAGALGGTLLYKHRSQESAAEVQTTIPDAEQASSQTAAVADAGGATLVNALSTTDENALETVAPETVAPEIAARGDSTPPESSTQSAPPTRSTARDRDVKNSRDDEIVRENGDDSEREIRREERREARKEARRRERETQREARRGRDTSDDLLRIREIFEGAPKP